MGTKHLHYHISISSCKCLTWHMGFVIVTEHLF